MRAFLLKANTDLVFPVYDKETAMKLQYLIVLTFKHAVNLVGLLLISLSLSKYIASGDCWYQRHDNGLVKHGSIYS